MKYGLMSYQVFIGDDLPANVKEAVQAIPELENLFCSVENLESKRRLIKESGTSEHVYYEAAIKKVSELR